MGMTEERELDLRVAELELENKQLREEVARLKSEADTFRGAMVHILAISKVAFALDEKNKTTEGCNGLDYH